MNKFLAKIVAWITAGYPEGVPGPDRVPLFALLKPRLTDDEVKTVARELINRGEFDHVDIGVLITQLTDELPAPDDVERVRTRLLERYGIGVIATSATDLRIAFSCLEIVEIEPLFETLHRAISELVSGA